MGRIAEVKDAERTAERIGRMPTANGEATEAKAKEKRRRPARR